MSDSIEQCEWQFDQPPSRVDLDRLWRELMGLPAIAAFAYLEQLRIKAQRTYALLRQKRLSAGCKVFTWPVT